MSLGKIEDPELKVAVGYYSDMNGLYKFGINHNIDSGEKFPIWDVKGDYTYSDTADIDKIASSDNLDTQVIRVYGRDLDGNPVVQDVTLTGQTPVTLATPLRRCHRAYNTADSLLAGDIYIGINSATFSAGVIANVTELRAKIVVGYEQTQMAIYSIAKGYTLYIKKWKTGIKKKDSTQPSSVTSQLLVREPGQTFRVREEIPVTHEGGIADEIREYFLKIPENSDIMIVVDNDATNNVVVSASFQGVLIKNQSVR